MVVVQAAATLGATIVLRLALLAAVLGAVGRRAMPINQAVVLNNFATVGVVQVRAAVVSTRTIRNTSFAAIAVSLGTSSYVSPPVPSRRLARPRPAVGVARAE